MRLVGYHLDLHNEGLSFSWGSLEFARGWSIIGDAYIEIVEWRHGWTREFGTGWRFQFEVEEHHIELIWCDLQLRRYTETTSYTQGVNEWKTYLQNLHIPTVVSQLQLVLLPSSGERFGTCRWTENWNKSSS